MRKNFCKCMFLFCLFILNENLNAIKKPEDYVTIFEDLDWKRFSIRYKDNLDPTLYYVDAALYSVEIVFPYYTKVTICLRPYYNMIRLKVSYSSNTWIESGDAKLPLRGIVREKSNSGRLKLGSCRYKDNVGWDNVCAGDERYYTLLFAGVFPDGYTDFNLVDYGTKDDPCGYSFRDYTINNPVDYCWENGAWIRNVWDEKNCKANIDKNNDGICGIYEEIGGSKSKMAVVKDVYDGNYYIHYLRDKDKLSWWFEGDIKAYLEESAIPQVFKGGWITRMKDTAYDAYVTFDNITMTSVITEKENSSPIKSTYLKMYPKVSNDGIDNDGYDYDYDYGEKRWTGTGFALNNNYIVTNHHVVKGAKRIYIHGVNGDFNNKYRATVIASDNYNDLAILKVEGVTIASSNIPYSIKTTTSEVGEEVFVLGFPLTGSMGNEVKLTTGIISSKTGYLGDVALYQVSVPIQPGNSGGPLFDSRGNVIGIVSSKHTEAENAAYAIKTSYLRNLMESSISTNILPRNNKLSELNLKDKVKLVKKYVYYIICSN